MKGNKVIEDFLPTICEKCKWYGGVAHSGVFYITSHHPMCLNPKFKPETLTDPITGKEMLPLKDNYKDSYSSIETEMMESPLYIEHQGKIYPLCEALNDGNCEGFTPKPKPKPKKEDRASGIYRGMLDVLDAERYGFPGLYGMRGLIIDDREEEGEDDEDKDQGEEEDEN